MPADWNSLPLDVQEQVLGYLTGPGLSRHTRVSKFFHSIVGKKTMARLKLTQATVDHLSIVRLGQHLVRYILLEVELPYYDCDDCELQDGDMAPVDTTFVAQALFNLLDIIRNWDNPGLTLDFNIYCPEDEQHWFQHWLFTSDHEGEKCDAEAPLPQAEVLSDANHG
jgi:hypothetical protein